MVRGEINQTMTSIIFRWVQVKFWRWRYQKA